MNKITPTILVLGAEGMLGHTVFNYLHSSLGHTVYGTSRSKDSNLLSLSVDNASYDLKEIVNQIGPLHFVINCIGKIAVDDNRIELITTNALFPHQLELLAKMFSFNLIHISTDAVFSNQIEIAYEDTPPSPDSLYGASKLLGETVSENALTIRSSFLGLDHKKHKGLLEWVLTSKDKQLSGFINHEWSGCTTLQFAKFCEYIIKNNLFLNLRSLSPVFHFIPIRPLRKYDIVKTFSYLVHIQKEVLEVKAPTYIPRTLYTRFPSQLTFSNEWTTLQEELLELLAFENEV